MESLREAMQTPGVSDSAANLLTKGWRSGTQTAYSSAWNVWTSWCEREQIDPFQATVETVSNFLAHSFDRGREYSTLNGYRAALSAIHPEIDGHKVGQHPMIVKLMRGVFNERAPIPKYTDTWDVDQVLTKIKSLGGNEEMTMKNLTLKLAMLMALTSACRGSELQKANLKGMVVGSDEVCFQLLKPTKTSRPGKPLLKLTFQRYPLNAQLDVVDCLETYMIVRTTLWRKKPEQNQLFLAHIEKHGPVVTCTIARWIKTLMGMSGIDTDKYTAHSTRAASTSKAKTQGLSTEQIVKRASWSRSATFFRFYHKDIQVETDEFQTKVYS
jgi:hypothetical protein